MCFNCVLYNALFPAICQCMHVVLMWSRYKTNFCWRCQMRKRQRRCRGCWRPASPRYYRPSQKRSTDSLKYIISFIITDIYYFNWSKLILFTWRTASTEYCIPVARRLSIPSGPSLWPQKMVVVFKYCNTLTDSIYVSSLYAMFCPSHRLIL